VKGIIINMMKLIDFFIGLFSHLIPKKYKEKYFTILRSEGFMYLVFGALTTIVSYVTYAVATRIFQIGIIPADIISWVCSVAFAFVTNKLYVFKSTSNSIKNVTKEAVSFVTARLLSLGMEVGMIYVMILPVIGINDLVAKLIANIAVIIANYFLSKLIIFKKK